MEESIIQHNSRYRDTIIARESRINLTKTIIRQLLILILMNNWELFEDNFNILSIGRFMRKLTSVIDFFSYKLIYNLYKGV